MDDFDALLELDSAAVAAGAEAGRAAAAATSTRDGFALGYAKGGELAVEVSSHTHEAIISVAPPAHDHCFPHYGSGWKLRRLPRSVGKRPAG